MHSADAEATVRSLVGQGRRADPCGLPGQVPDHGGGPRLAGRLRLARAGRRVLTIPLTFGFHEITVYGAVALKLNALLRV
jgi:hypothetical protein